MNILDNIIAHKKRELLLRKSRNPIKELEKTALFGRQTLSMKKALLNRDLTGIIAEFKRKSPSKGMINPYADVACITGAYALHGAAGLSVLTDSAFFGGDSADLIQARVNQVPILRKDFIVDEYQIVEARAMGADTILLIAACLSVAETGRLAAFARSLDLEVLLEVHDREELGHIGDDISLVGVNNRDLKTFQVELSRSIELKQYLPKEMVTISESGIQEVSTIRRLREAGFDGFLIGESFMKEPDPAIAFARFVNDLKNEIHAGESLRHDATRPGQKA